MDIATRPDAARARPIQNMRITLWGVQGSCPIFPSPDGVREFSRRLAVQTLQRAFEHLGRTGQPISVEQALGGPATAENIARFQEKLGLPDLRIFGGETTSIEIVTSEGNTILLDAGSGLRRCSFEVLQRLKDDPERKLHLFGSHEHLDHRVGFTFARFLYWPEAFDIHVYGPYRFLFALDQQYGIFSHQTGPMTYLNDPVDYSLMTARFTATEFVRPADASPEPRSWNMLELSPIRIGSTLITPFEVYHPVRMCLGYKIEHNGKTFVYATDHELRHGEDAADPRQQRSDSAEANLRLHCRDADLLYVDGQYRLAEYMGQTTLGTFPPMSRMDWGHGCIEDIVERAQQCRIRQTLIGHHDPERSWTQRAEMDQHLSRLCEGKSCQVHMADGDAVIEL